MARPKKATIDYFPHHTEHGKTLFILESRWGNDGYAAWFKILEMLGASDGLFIDCRNEFSWQHLAAFTRVDGEKLKEIIDILSILGKIDRELWNHGIIYCQKFVDGVTDAYRRRKESLPSREKVISVTNVDLAGLMPAETPLVDEVTGLMPAEVQKGKGKGKGKEEKEDIVDIPPEDEDEDLGDKSPPPSSLFNLWNKIIDNPKATAMNKTREAKCRLRLKERSLDDWESIFLQIKRTPFLCGDNDRGWRADLDWIINNDTNALKIIEGKYLKARIDGGGNGAGRPNDNASARETYGGKATHTDELTEKFCNRTASSV